MKTKEPNTYIDEDKLQNKKTNTIHRGEDENTYQNTQ